MLLQRLRCVICADFDVCGGVSAGAQIKSEKELHEGMLQNDRQSWVRTATYYVYVYMYRIYRLYTLLEERRTTLLPV